MHRPQRTHHGAGATAGRTNQLPASSESRARMSTLVLLITRDLDLTNRLTKTLSAFAGDTLTIESVDRVSDATQRLKQSDGVRALMMDWDLSTTPGFETLLVLMGAAPE